MKIKRSIFIIFTFWINSIFAQTADTLELSELMNSALENNFSIKLVKNEAEISKINNTYGNAGFLPKIDLNANGTQSIYSSRTEYFDDSDILKENLSNTSLDAFVKTDWILFDGMKMFIRKSKLAEIEKQGEIRIRSEIESVYLKLSSLYYQLVQEQKLLQVLKYTVEISKFRLDLVNKKFSLGSASEIDRIQAALDFNNDSSMLILQENLVKDLKVDINTVLSRDPDFQFTVGTEVPILSDLKYEALLRSFEDQNVELLFVNSMVRVKYSELKETKTNFLPVLSLYADYEYYNSEYSGGTIKRNQTIGPSAGLKLSYTVFDGLNNSRSRQIAQINYESSQLQSEKLRNELKSALYKTFIAYSSGLRQIELEKKNLEDARKNLEFAVQLYKLGSINEIEFREIQRKEFESENRLLSVQYSVKIAEIKLIQLSGQLKYE